jgi:hypothetical protein
MHARTPQALVRDDHRSPRDMREYSSRWSPDSPQRTPPRFLVQPLRGARALTPRSPMTKHWERAPARETEWRRRDSSLPSPLSTGAGFSMERSTPPHRARIGRAAEVDPRPGRPRVPDLSRDVQPIATVADPEAIPGSDTSSFCGRGRERRARIRPQALGQVSSRERDARLLPH